MNKVLISLSLLFSILIIQAQTLNARSSSIHMKGPFLRDKQTTWGEFKPSDLISSQPSNVKNQTFRNIHLTAPFTFHNIKSLGKASIQGPVKEGRKGVFNILNVTGTVNAQYITAQQLYITGNCTFQNLHVKGPSTIKGNIDITNGNMSKLDAYSDHIKLKNVNLDNLIVHRPLQGGKPVIELEGNTNISRVEFKDVKGVIKKDRTVKIPQKIEGASIS